MLIDVGVDAFIESVAEQAAAHGSRPALAAAALALAEVVEVEPDLGALRLFEADRGDPPAPGPELAPAPRLLGLNGSGPGPGPGRGRGPDGQGPLDGRCSAAVLLGRCLEATLTDAQRVIGAHHTPFLVSSRVVDVAMGDGRTEAARRRSPVTVCDPAVGGGVFLIAAADRLCRTGRDPSDAVAALWGFDIDPVAVAVTEAALAIWSGVGSVGSADQLCVADFLLDDLVDEAMPAGGWSYVVGNPPFRSQLAGRTARDRSRAEALHERYGATARGYVDEAGLFLLAGAQRLGDQGRLALIVPTSIASARDARPLRRALDACAPLGGMWLPDGQVFPAAVDTLAPVLGRGGRPETVQLVIGRSDGFDELRPVPTVGEQWSELLADAEDVPRVTLDQAAVLGDVAHATAGFRQHFYAMVGAVTDSHGDGAVGAGTRPVTTVGLIDPLTSHWGDRTTRLGGRTFHAPVVDPTAIDDEAVAEWIEERRRPKVLVATQTRVLEAVVDPVGHAVPSTPVISVEPVDPADLWRVAAVLCAPPVTAWLHRRAAGGGLSQGRVRPSATLVRSMPLPPHEGLWAEGAARVEQASAEADVTQRRTELIEVGEIMTRAYGAEPAITAWWQELLPAVR